ncbi:hypothetical protein [Novosphingobium sp.]|uniref:hypothetical protein n=1 Tax=Novosphingobium sp. TaxID=1874826 RepID=UPI00262AEA9F|nr:hypothetical protein [Novosphingobium sp.]
MQQWLFAVRLITSHPGSIASTQLAKDIGVTQDTAWHMMTRLAQFIGKSSIRFSDDEKAALIDQLVQRRFEQDQPLQSSAVSPPEQAVCAGGPSYG